MRTKLQNMELFFYQYEKASDANLIGANLRGADLRDATGYIPMLPTLHGYFPYATQMESGDWKVRAGCHLVTFDEGREYWGLATTTRAKSATPTY